ncbi:MAG TPA: J domain-containing protein [Spirochaetota bacterium]|nr:J domain-containing protein [Spirochaetota bacterium]HPI90528.1 J domain-containing protein [Spirochaetota bacterium]HPR47872.1 J domain-containing protein [Spirochaetota bacterium]
MNLWPYNIDEITAYLESLTEPVMEADILKQFSSLDYFPRETEELFLHHFSLYHGLYKARNPLAHKGMYLHLDPMRIRLVPYPHKGSCFHYASDTGSFCNIACENAYCEVHQKIYHQDSRRPGFDLLYDFYCNEENIEFGKSDLLGKLMNGVIVYSFKKGEIDRALKFFGITNPSSKIIARKYHALAMRYHPDRNNGDDSDMKELNRSYQILREVFVL